MAAGCHEEGSNKLKLTYLLCFDCPDLLLVRPGSSVVTVCSSLVSGVVGNVVEIALGNLWQIEKLSFSLIILSHTSCARIANWVRFLHVFRQWTSVNLWPRPYRDSDLNAVSPLCFDIGSVAPTLYRTMMWVLCLLVFCLQNLWFCCGSFLFQDLFFWGGWLGIFPVFGILVLWSSGPLVLCSFSFFLILVL